MPKSAAFVSVTRRLGVCPLRALQPVWGIED